MPAAIRCLSDSSSVALSVGRKLVRIQPPMPRGAEVPLELRHARVEGAVQVDLLVRG